MIRVVLFGICGRMGRMTADELSSREDMTLVAGVERPDHPQIGATLAGAQIYTDGDALPEADAWLDFSLADPALEHARRAARIRVPLVIAATGFSQAQSDEIWTLAQSCPILLAPNLSTGIGVMERLVADAARLLKDGFDPAIRELHHSTKRDAPSGTALRLAQAIAGSGSSPQIVSLRAGGAVGEHAVHFVGVDEELVIIHRAWSRRAFSRGAPRALRFVTTQSPGLYTIRDLYQSG